MEQEKLNMKNIAKRMAAPTPPFWKKIRNIMLAIGGVSGAIVAAPIALPATVITIAGYGIAIGTVGAALAQTTKEDKKEN